MVKSIPLPSVYVGVGAGFVFSCIFSADLGAFEGAGNFKFMCVCVCVCVGWVGRLQLARGPISPPPLRVH